MDSITSVIADILDYMDGSRDPDDFQQCLIENGFMIVPIEDPTNLRFGVDDD